MTHAYSIRVLTKVFFSSFAVKQYTPNFSTDNVNPPSYLFFIVIILISARPHT